MNRQGYSILEALVAMTVFAIGMLALAQSYLGVVRAQVNARNHEMATQCAKDRLEEIVNSIKYADIADANFPDETYGQVNGGNSAYAQFSRTVTIADSTNALGTSVLKEVTVDVAWQSASGVRNVALNTVVASYKDITP